MYAVRPVFSLTCVHVWCMCVYKYVCVYVYVCVLRLCVCIESFKTIIQVSRVKETLLGISKNWCCV